MHRKLPYFQLWIMIVNVLSCVEGCSLSSISQCTCTDTAVACSGIGFTAVPSEFPNGTTEIELIINKITSIEDDSFTGLTDLEKLALSRNEIITISSGAFSDLSKLKKIYFDHNKIASLPAGLFSNNPLLKEVQFHYNNLADISANVFLPVTTIVSLQINDNKWTCCSMTDFVHWVTIQTVLTPVTVVCPDYGDTSSINIATFNTSACPVDGQWGTWTNSTCSVTCGTGNINRTRECNNPPQAGTGQDCIGNNTEIVQCSNDCEGDPGKDPEKDLDWMPIILGIVVGLSLSIGVIALLTIMCKKKSSLTSKISNKHNSPPLEHKIGWS